MNAVKFALTVLFTASLALPAMAQTAAAPSTAKPAAAAPATGAAPAAKPAAPRIVKSTTVVVSINTATAEQLQQVKGIGKSHANAIIKGRPFKAVDELVSKKILSQTEFDKLKAQFSL